MKYFPKTREELDEIIDSLLKERGLKADLNDIDTSAIDDMSGLFTSMRTGGALKNKTYNKKYDFSKFNGNISGWNVSNVTDISYMFCSSKFNGNIGNWDVSNVEKMTGMFLNSAFNKDLSEWDVSNVRYMIGMFAHSKFNGDISKWNVHRVLNMSDMFMNSKFAGDLSSWTPDTMLVKFDNMFKGCPAGKQNEPWWFKSTNDIKGILNKR